MIEEVIRFLGPTSSFVDNGFLMFLLEIVRNIYDHADGLGYLFLRQDGGDVFFEVKDSGTECFDLSEVKKRGSTKYGNGTNFGMGLCGGMIEDVAETLGINLTIDTSRGFRYTGNYRMR